MRKLIPILALLAASASADAANCKFKKNEIDPFDKIRIMRTGWVPLQSSASRHFGELIGALSNIEVAGVREGDRLYLRFKVRLNDATQRAPMDRQLRDAIYVLQGATLAIVLADESHVDLYAEKTVRGTTRAKRDGQWYEIRSTIDQRYEMHESVIGDLMAQDALAIRMSVKNGDYSFATDEGYIDFGINKQSQSDIRNTIACLHGAG